MTSLADSFSVGRNPYVDCADRCCSHVSVTRAHEMSHSAFPIIIMISQPLLSPQMREGDIVQKNGENFFNSIIDSPDDLMQTAILDPSSRNRLAGNDHVYDMHLGFLNSGY